MSKASKPWAPEKCPITQRPFFMWIEHHKTGEMVPTYGGPYDSYTIPIFDGDDFWCERYDHDAGCWMDNALEDVGLMLVNDQSLVFGPEHPRYNQIEAFASAPVSAEPVGLSLEVRTLGSYGKAFDLPGNRRAYTYEHQPLNVEASLLGGACNSAAKLGAGDVIDRGLGLLKELQKRGFGVFEVDSSRWHAAPVTAQPDQDLTQQTLDDVKAGIPARDAEIEALRKEIEALQAVQPRRLIFPTMLRKMWSGSEVQAWLDDELSKLTKSSSQRAQQPVSGADGRKALESAAITLALISGFAGTKSLKTIKSIRETARYAHKNARAALAQQASRPEAVPGNSEILDLAISEGLSAKDGVYCGSAATILCFAGTLIRGAALAQQDADKVDTALAEMVHAMFRSGNSVPVTRITIDRKQYDAIACAARKEPDQ